MSVGGSAASGLQAGFDMGLRATAQEDARKQREFENARQTAADQQRSDQLARANTAQDKASAEHDDDRALSGVTANLEDARYQLGALHAKYGDQPIPDSEAKPLYEAVGQHFKTKQALLAKRYQPVVDQTQQKWRDFASKAEAGQADPGTLRGQDLRDFIKATTGHDLSEYANGTVGTAINDATAGVESKNMSMAVRAAGTLLGPQIRQGLGGVAPDGSTIINKDLYALVPAPAQGMQPGQQAPVAPLRGLMDMLNSATAPQAPAQGMQPGQQAPVQPSAAGAAQMGAAPAPAQDPNAPAGSGTLTPGSDPNLLMPVLEVTTRQPDGRITTYHAPVTKGRGTDPNDELAKPLQMSELMDRMGRLGVVDNWLKTPQMADAVKEALAGGPTSFEQAWGMVHGDPKALAKTAAEGDTTSKKIEAIKKLAKDLYGGDFTAAAQALTGKMGVGASQPAAGAASAPAPVTGLGTTVAPAEQQARDAEALKIMEGERPRWEKALADAKASGDQGAITKAQGDLDAFNRGVDRQQKLASAPGAAAPAGPVSAKIAIKHGASALSPEQNAALFGPKGAVTEGRLDIGKINSRTASLFADAELANPGTDLAKKSADIQLSRNATFRQKAMTAEVLPEIMQNMVDAGKKVNFSNFEPLGQMQAWTLGKVNDPDLTEYMTQRNDALMTIAGVMRGVGMTDKAHQAEIEVAKPTMSPQALDAWFSGQMKSLAPRLKLNRGITHSEPPAPAPAATMKAPPAGTVLKGYRFKGGDPSQQANWEKQ